MSDHSPLSIESIGDVKHIRFRDRQIEHDAIMQIQQETLQLIKQQQPPKILLDFQQVDYLPTTGLGMLVSIQTSTHRKNGQLRLANLQTLIRETLRVSRLDQILDIHDTTESALASFES